MLDARVYRAAFVPLLLALFVAAFSLERRPGPATTVLASDAFSGPRAFATLEGLAASFPARRPGSGLEEELARRVAAAMRRSGFKVSERVKRGRPVGGAQDALSVVGIRPGISSRRIVVVADRTAIGVPSAARLSGTAALLELAQVFRSAEVTPSSGAAQGGEPGDRAVGRDLRRTLVLVSTSGASLGGTAPVVPAIRELAGPPGRIDAVLHLGDLAGGRVRKPWVVPWSNGSRRPPLGLRRTVEAAVRAEVGAPPGGPRASAQWARRAFPLTVSDQGESAASGLPAVLLQVSGERGPTARTPVTQERLTEFGRAALRAVTAVDTIGTPAAGSRRRTPADDGPRAFSTETSGIVTIRRVLPDWAVRLLVGAALLPALFAALDGFFRVRRRRLRTRGLLAWVALGGLPLLAAYAWLRILALTGALDAPAAPVLPQAVPVGAVEIAVLVSLVLVLGGTWLLVRRVRAPRLGLGLDDDPAGVAGAASVGLLVASTTVAVWLFNPYAAGILLPAAHLWLLTTDSGSRMPSRPAAALAAVGLLLPALVVLYYALALGLSPGGVAWLLVLIGAGGHVSIPAAVVLSVLAGCALATGSVLASRRRRPGTPTAVEEAALRTRGPASYAGPGSLGGTESALRR